MTDDLFLRRVGDAAPLPEDEERRLARRARDGDGDARRRLVEANLRLVVFFARRAARSRRGVSLADLVQEGALGLSRAAERYDPDRGPRFGTFARWYVLDALRGALAQPVAESLDVQRVAVAADPADEMAPSAEFAGVTVVRRALASIPAAERRVLALRFGLDGGRERSRAQVARVLGADRSRVAMVERRALTRLQKALEEPLDPGACC